MPRCRIRGRNPFRVITTFGRRGCRATLKMSEEGLWKYQESLIALMRALGLGREYWKELDFARRMSKNFASPYAIEIVEIP